MEQREDSVVYMWLNPDHHHFEVLSMRRFHLSNTPHTILIINYFLLEREILDLWQGFQLKAHFLQLTLLCIKAQEMLTLTLRQAERKPSAVRVTDDP